MTPGHLLGSLSGHHKSFQQQRTPPRRIPLFSHTFVVACALAGRPGEAYNLASGQEVLIRDWATTINTITGNIAPVEIKPPRPWDNSGRRFGSKVKSFDELGFVAEVATHVGLKNTVQWMADNREYIRSTIAKHDLAMSQFEPN